MNPLYRLSEAAEADLLAIWVFIAQDNAPTADRVLNRIYNAFLLLGEQPGAGHKREDLANDADLRFWSVYSYLIIYRKMAEPIEIVRVVRGTRDVVALLQPER